MHEALKQRRRRRAREELARYKAARTRSASDDSFLRTWLEAATRAGGDLRQPFAEHPGVFRAIDAIVRDMGGVPWQIWDGATEDDKREVLAGPWYDFFADPSPDFDLGTIRAVTRLWTLLDGEAFWILRARDGSLADPRQLPGMIEPVRGTRMKELFDPVTKAFVGWEMERGEGRGKLRLLREQVVHFRPIPDPENPRRGLAPLSPLRRSVRTDAKAHQWNEASLENGAEPGVVFERDKDAPDLAPEQVQQLRQQYVDQHAGPGNARKPVILAGGMKLNTFGWSPKDMEYGEQRKWSRFEIASAYGVPLMLMGDMSEVHSKESARTVLKLYWENTVKPRLIDEAQALDRQLFLGRGQGETASSQRVWAWPDFSGIAALQTEETERRSNAEADRRLGFPLNEINRRHELGYEDQEAGDVGLVSGGLVPVTAVGFQFPEEEPPAPPADDEPEEDEPEDDEGAIDEGDGEDDEGRAAPRILVVRAGPITGIPDAEQRAVLWHQYIRGIQRPGEQRMRAAVLAWMRDIRREVLRFVERAGRGARNVRTMTEVEIAAFLAQKEREWDEAIVAGTSPVTEWVVEQSLARLAAQIGADMPNKTSPRLLNFLNEMGARKVTRVSDTLKTHIRAELLEGVGNAENITDLQARVKAVMNAGAARSLAIARTETGTASTGSRFEAARETGVQLKQWISSRDDEVRDEHQIDGEERGFEEPFSNGLMYPLDVDATNAGLVVNCRCDWIPIRPEITIL